MWTYRSPANHDVQVQGAPVDTVQKLKFSPVGMAQTFLASGSWDNVLRVWQMQADGQAQGTAEQTLQGPVLDLDWSTVRVSE